MAEAAPAPTTSLQGAYDPSVHALRLTVGPPPLPEKGNAPEPPAVGELMDKASGGLAGGADAPLQPSDSEMAARVAGHAGLPPPAIGVADTPAKATPGPPPSIPASARDEYARSMVSGETTGPQDFAERFAGAVGQAARQAPHNPQDDSNAALGEQAKGLAALALHMARGLPTQEDLIDSSIRVAHGQGGPVNPESARTVRENLLSWWAKMGEGPNDAEARAAGDPLFQDALTHPQGVEPPEQQHQPTIAELSKPEKPEPSIWQTLLKGLLDTLSPGESPTDEDKAKIKVLHPEASPDEVDLMARLTKGAGTPVERAGNLGQIVMQGMAGPVPAGALGAGPAILRTGKAVEAATGDLKPILTNLDDDLNRLRTNGTADQVSALKLIGTLPPEMRTKAIRELAYTEIEQRMVRANSAQNPEVRALLRTLKPLTDQQRELGGEIAAMIGKTEAERAGIGLQSVEEGHVHRVVIGRERPGGLIDPSIEQPDVITGASGGQRTLSKFAAGMQHRSDFYVAQHVPPKEFIPSWAHDLAKPLNYTLELGKPELSDVLAPSSIHQGFMFSPKSGGASGILRIPGDTEALTQKWYGLDRHEIIAHEIGHAADYAHNISADLTPELRAELTTVSQKFRPKMWDFHGKAIASDDELVADAVANWITKPASRKSMPLFGAKWGDTLNTYAGIVDKAKAKVAATPPLRTWGTTPIEEVGGMGAKHTDLSGGTWTVKPATTEEIEANTAIKYHKDFIANTIDDVLRLKRVKRNLDFLGAHAAALEDKGLFVPRAKAPPLGVEGMKEVDLPQMKGWADPKVANVLNDFFRRDPGDLDGFLMKANRFLTGMMFATPVPHIANVGTHWAVGRGWEWLTPRGYGSLVADGARAVRAVWTLNDDYLSHLRQGAGLLSASTEMENFHSLMMNKLFNEQLMDEGGIWSSFAKSVLHPAATAADLVRAEYRWSRRTLWAVNDMFMLHRQFELERHGLPQAEAIFQAEKDIPNYRVPSEVLGSHAVSQALQSGVFAMFGRYKYGLVRSLALMVNDLARGSAMEKLEAVGKLTVLGALAYAWPSWARPSGPVAVIKAGAALLTEGQQKWQSFVSSLMILSPVMDIAQAIARNTDNYGNAIVKEGASAGGAALEALEGAAKQTYPGQLALALMKPGGLEKVLGQLVNLKTGPQYKESPAQKRRAAAEARRAEQRDPIESWVKRHWHQATQ